MQDPSTLPVINKDEQLSDSLNYDFLYQKGIEKIGQYSGEAWNNYNDSDPGITILQSLCYALTELGYKANLPIEDILPKNQKGQVVMFNRFVPPPQILPTNPVSLIDFKKVIVDCTDEIKQVYFKHIQTELNANVFIPYLELTPEAYEQIEKQNKKQQEKDNELGLAEQIQLRVETVLYQKGNFGQLYLEPQILNPNSLNIKGNIVVDAATDADLFAAKLIFLLNNLFSPYPVYYSYEEQLNKGLNNDEIFDGPLLKGGFLEDTDFKPKREEITVHEIMAAIDDMEEVILVDELNIGEKTEILFDEILYVSFDSLFGTDGTLNIIQNGSVVSWLSEAQVDYELKKIIPEPQPKTEYQDYYPTGQPSGIDEYYSIMHQFPEVYNLTRSSFKNKREEANVKQLKAYLALFEQTMSNYLSQLNFTGRLFDFDSGRNCHQVVGKTYYFNDIYDVPGIQYILKDVKGYSKYYGQSSSDLKDWNAYKRDPLNPYRQQLAMAVESQGVNLDRKARVLKHLLARFGADYQSDYLHLTNPDYGKPETAVVKHVSETLKSFSLFSANRIRTYFFPKTELVLLSGLELTAGNQLNINGYYNWMLERIEYDQQTKKIKLSALTAILNHKKRRVTLLGDKSFINKKAVGPNGVEIYVNGELGFFLSSSFITKQKPVSKEELEKRIQATVRKCAIILDFYVTNTFGIIAIDHARLLSFLDLRFVLKKADTNGGKILYTSDYLSFSAISRTTALIYGDLPFTSKLTGLNNYEIGIKTNLPVNEKGENPEGTINDQTSYWYPICSGIQTYEALEEIAECLSAIRKGENNRMKILVPSAEGEDDKMAVPKNFFLKKVTVVLPFCVPLFHQDDYRTFLQRTLINTASADAMVQTIFLPLNSMIVFLKGYAGWMNGIKKQFKGEGPGGKTKNGILKLLHILIKEND
ncbi:MAG: hypothetical protein AAFZ15_23485 [Bacteroidota bacterium]